MPVAATDNAKCFVCKYVGTPGVDEGLQTGDNPISVSENAIAGQPGRGRRVLPRRAGPLLVLAEDTGQPEPEP